MSNKTKVITFVKFSWDTVFFKHVIILLFIHFSVIRYEHEQRLS